MSKLVVLMIEDNIEQMKEMEKKIEDTYSELKEKDIIKLSDVGFDALKIEKVWGNGSGNIKFRSYDDGIISELLGRVKAVQEAGDIAGVFLDSVLNMSELEAIGINDYANIKLARKILEECEKNKVNVYVVSSIGNFDTSSLRIMGRSMEGQYIPKSLLLEYPSQKAIYKIFYYLGNGEPVEQEKLDEVFEQEKKNETTGRI